MADVLMLFIAGQSGWSGHSGLAMQRFDDEKACTDAGNAAKMKWDKADFLCQPASSKSAQPG